MFSKWKALRHPKNNINLNPRIQSRQCMDVCVVIEEAAFVKKERLNLERKHHNSTTRKG